MSAPLGNQFWKARATSGRDKIFSTPECLWLACCEYFQWVEDNPLIEMKPFAFQGDVTQEPVPKMRAMTINGLCIFLGIDQKTWSNYKNNEGYEDFFPIITQAESVIYEQKFTAAAADLLNANIISRELGLADKARIDHQSTDGSMATKATLDTSKLSDEQLAALLDARIHGPN